MGFGLETARAGFRVQLAFKFKLAGLSESGAVTMSRAFRRNGVRLMMEMPVTGCRATQGPWPASGWRDSDAVNLWRALLDICVPEPVVAGFVLIHIECPLIFNY